MTVHAFDLVLLPDLIGKEDYDVKVLIKCDTHEEESDIVSLAKVRLGGEDLNPSSFEGPKEYLESARMVVVDTIKHFTGQEEEIRPFDAPQTAMDVCMHIMRALGEG